MKNLLFAVLGAVLLVTTGCHSASKSNAGFTRPILLDSKPQGAVVTKEDGTYIGTTPFTHLASPRKENKLRFSYPGYQPREVVIKAAVWGQSSPLDNAGNMAASAIIPPVGLAMFSIDHWGTKMDRDFMPITIELQPINQPLPIAQPVLAAQPQPVQFAPIAVATPTVMYRSLPSQLITVYTQSPPVTVYYELPEVVPSLTHLPDYVPNMAMPGISVFQRQKVEELQEKIRVRQGSGPIASVPSSAPMTLVTRIPTNTPSHSQPIIGPVLPPTGPVAQSAPASPVAAQAAAPAPTNAVAPTNQPAATNNTQTGTLSGNPVVAPAAPTNASSTTP